MKDQDVMLIGDRDYVIAESDLDKIVSLKKENELLKNDLRTLQILYYQLELEKKNLESLNAEYQKNGIGASIEKLNLPVYVESYLKENDLYTIRSLVNLSYQNLIDFGLSEGYVKQINIKLALYSLPVFIHPKSTNEQGLKETIKEKIDKRAYVAIQNYDLSADVLEAKIECLDLESRIYNIFKREQIYFVSDLLEYDWEDFLMLKNLGQKGRERLAQSLAIFLSKSFQFKKSR